MTAENANQNERIRALEALQKKMGKWRVGSGNDGEARDVGVAADASNDSSIEMGKFMALGRFASDVSHNVRNPLAVILGWAEILRDRVPPEDTMSRNAVKNIIEATMRADGLMRNLSRTVKPFKPQWEDVDVSYLIKDTLELVRFRDSMENVRVATKFPEKEFLIRSDKNLLRMGLFNLIMNALEALQGNGGEIRIEVETTQDEAGEPLCRISIQDNGCGIDPGMETKIFQLFSSTKQTSGKVGLGLPISRMIIESHGGTISFKSSKGKGTLVQVLLPVG